MKQQTNELSFNIFSVASFLPSSVFSSIHTISIIAYCCNIFLSAQSHHHEVKIHPSLTLCSKEKCNQVVQEVIKQNPITPWSHGDKVQSYFESDTEKDDSVMLYSFYSGVMMIGAILRACLVISFNSSPFSAHQHSNTVDVVFFY